MSDAATARIAGLVRAGRFGEALNALDQNLSRSTPPSDAAAALRAELLQHTGAWHEAREMSERLLRKPALTAALRARCHVVLGDLHKTHGDSLAALDEYRKAVANAERAGDRVLMCWAQLWVLLTVCDTTDGGQALVGMLPEVRRNVAAAGDPHLSAALHIYVGQIESQRHLMRRARQHLRVAAALVDAHPNDYLQGSLAIAELCLAYLDSDFDLAFAKARDARRFVESSAEAGMRVALLSNLGHLHLAQGQFADAETALGEALERAPRGTRIEAAILEGLARLRLAEGRDEECRSLLARVVAIQAERSATLYEQCCTYLTRIRLHLRSGPRDELARLLEEARPLSEQTGDRRLQSLLTLYRAEHAALAGNVGLARSLVQDVDAAFDGRSLELLAEIDRASALIAASGASGSRASALRTRSARIAKAIGDLSALAGAPPDPPLLAEHAGASAPPDGSRPGDLVERSARLLDQASVPWLVGVEALEMLRDLDPGVGSFLIRRHADGRLERVVDPDTMAVERVAIRSLEPLTVMFLGADGPWTWSLCCDPREGGVDAARDITRVARLVAVARERAAAERASGEREALWPPADAELPGEGAIGASRVLQEHLSVAQKLATSSITMLITGETGTGKEVLARAIHEGSSRAGKPFLPFNCATVPRDIVEGQLFGFRRGAFTGALESSPGVIRAAVGGTLFLDEVGELAPEIQPKFLRFLESREIHPLGEPHPIKVDVRIIAATNQQLETLVEQGRFREDLYYRLNVIRFRIPPLRERRQEIPVLAEHLLRRFADELGKGRLRLSDEAMEYLLLYTWPGNVRQLANQLHRMAALAEPGAVLTPEHLSPEIAATRRTVPVSARALDATELVVRLDQPLAAAIDHVERAAIRRALHVSGGALERAAKLLGLSRKGLYLKRQRFDADQK
jgi:DNA-binding NtrC family response regulator/tetratricopeptide (TPR) repeat protein